MYQVIINDNEANEGFFTSNHSELEYAKNKAEYHESIGHDVRGVFEARHFTVDYFVGDKKVHHQYLIAAPKKCDIHLLAAIARIEGRKTFSETFSFDF